MARIEESGVYQIRNTVTGKVYVGSSKCLRSRRYVHFRNLDAGKHHSIKLQRSWIAHGRESFEFSVLERVQDVADLTAREQYWIDLLNAYASGYNSCPIAGRTIGWKMPEAQRLALSDFMKKREFSAEHREKIATSLRGRSLSQATREKIGASNRAAYSDPEVRKRCGVPKGTKRSQEVKEKLSAAQKAAWTPERRMARSLQARGRSHSAEAKAKIAESNRRRVVSQETREKHSEAQRRLRARLAVAKSGASQGAK